MAFTYDPTTDRGRVRLLIDDRDTVTVANQFFQDNEVDAFLSLEGQNVWFAASSALLQMAASEVMVQKRITLLDLSTDGPGEAQALSALADRLRERGEQGAADEAPFDIAEQVWTDFAGRERLLAQLQRGEA